MKKRLPQVTRLARQVGFTMIELLIVISILGILAVAVLAAINPIEQINRGKDTGSQQDAEQLLGAIDRYYASNGTYPWQGTGSNAANTYLAAYYDAANGNNPNANASPVLVDIAHAATYFNTDVNITDELKSADEIKTAFVDRLKNATNQIYVYYDGTPGDSVYTCFKPKSKDFRKKAAARCGNSHNATDRNIPTDLNGAVDTVCDTATTWSAPNISPNIYYCLP